MKEIICTRCGTTIQIDEAQPPRFCSHCGMAFVSAKVNVGTSRATSNGTAADSGKSTATDGFNQLVKQYYSYVNSYNIDLQAILKMCWLQAEAQMWEQSAKISYTEYEIKFSQADETRKHHNQQAENYNNTAYFDSEADERRARESIDTWRDEYHRQSLEADESLAQSKKELAKSKQKQKEMEQYAKSLTETTLKQTVLAYQTVCKMLEQYPNNPLGKLYMADYYRREVLWQWDIWKKALKYVWENWDKLEPQSERLYDIINKSVNVDNIHQDAKKYFTQAQSQLTKEMLAENAQLYNDVADFVNNYRYNLSQIKGELKEIDNYYDEQWSKSYRAEKRRKIIKQVIKWTIIVAAVIVAGIIVYRYVLAP